MANAICQQGPWSVTVSPCRPRECVCEGVADGVGHYFYFYETFLQTRYYLAFYRFRAISFVFSEHSPYSNSSQQLGLRQGLRAVKFEFGPRTLLRGYSARDIAGINAAQVSIAQSTDDIDIQDRVESPDPIVEVAGGSFAKRAAEEEGIQTRDVVGRVADSPTELMEASRERTRGSCVDLMASCSPSPSMFSPNYPIGQANVGLQVDLDRAIIQTKELRLAQGELETSCNFFRAEADTLKKDKEELVSARAAVEEEVSRLKKELEA
ncbi:hypothetical protein CR513_06755, partial [Mucuna pruriens]